MGQRKEKKIPPTPGGYLMSSQAPHSAYSRRDGFSFFKPKYLLLLLQLYSGFTSHNNYLQKKLTNKYTEKNWNFQLE